jgi:hypothetical protein
LLPELQITIQKTLDDLIQFSILGKMSSKIGQDNSNKKYNIKLEYTFHQYVLAEQQEFQFCDMNILVQMPFIVGMTGV